MNMKLNKVFVALTMIGTLGVAHAASVSDGYYVGVGLSQATANFDLGLQEYGVNDNKTYTVQRIDLQFGKSFNDFFALEARLGSAISSDNNDFNTNYQGNNIAVQSKGKLNESYGVYAIGKFPVGNITPYAMFGFTNINYTVDYSASANGMTNSQSDASSKSGISYGVGADYALNNAISIGAEFARLLDKSASKVDAFSLSLKYGF
jgi:outer membrane autotransporter protein